MYKRQGEGGPQGAGGRVDPGVDLDRVRAALVAAGDGERLGLGGPAEIVEQHLRAGGQQRGRLRVEVPEPAVGDVIGLVRLTLGDLARRGDGVGVRGEPYGGDGGEPADRAGVVVLAARWDAAMAFQLDRQVGGGGLDARQRGTQRTAQQLGEPEPERGGRGTGHGGGQLGRELHGGVAQTFRLGQ